MKSVLVSACLVAFSLSSCNKTDQVVQPVPTIEERINAENPMHTVTVTNPSTGNWWFSKSPGTGSPFHDAYAERGYLVVVADSKHYFNLSLAVEISISTNRVDVRY